MKRKERKVAHCLKIFPVFFEAVESGDKNFEIRKDDRNFKVGDGLFLNEWNPKTEEFTGRSIEKIISYIFEGGSFGVDPGTVILSIKSPKK